MRRILIVGAGQSGLQLALSLPRDRYQVTVMSARTPQELRTGRVTSTQVMFSPTLDLEREHGLHQWEHEAPALSGLNVTAADPVTHAPALAFRADFAGHAHSVDQRIKMSAWMETFVARGGKLLFHPVMTSELADLSRLYDLTIIAAGKGELVQLFDRDSGRSPFDRPQRRLSVVYVHGATPAPADSGRVGITVIPGVGELFIIPALTLSGPCDIVFWEAVPGGPLDVWDTLLPPDEHVKRTLELIRTWVPEQYRRFAGARPTDERCNLIGGYPPVVRHPVGELSATARVLGMADVVVANDPIAGQGSNNAARCAAIYRKAIVERGDEPFDTAWMTDTFETYWRECARHSTAFSNMLLGKPPAHLLGVLAAATGNATVADRFAAGYADPSEFEHWLLDPAKTAAYLDSVGTATA